MKSVRVLGVGGALIVAAAVAFAANNHLRDGTGGSNTNSNVLSAPGAAPLSLGANESVRQQSFNTSLAPGQELSLSSRAVDNQLTVLGSDGAVVKNIRHNGGGDPEAQSFQLPVPAMPGDYRFFVLGTNFHSDAPNPFDIQFELQRSAPSGSTSIERVDAPDADGVQGLVWVYTINVRRT